ncbi:alpha/beta fold hydrolase [Pseudonocardia sp. TRM90224]|uniref:alpha/beta fold hydrolase n=1 Tax=Pseudonocardia sp. TRM90224 TaxID=2812678 RepID=UPI001E3825FD|nr:alpha/beta fold hydrolase [Pseudonocardia sp. TRM90224]
MITKRTLDVPTRLGRLRVDVAGSGPALLFWPSLMMDRTLWDAQVAHFADRFTTIAVDPPGHGGSEALTRTFTLDSCAGCVTDVLDLLDFATADVVGNSWGAMTGGTFAARYPERVRRCVLLNGTASAAGWRQKVEYELLLQVSTLLGGVRPPLTSSVVKAFLGPTSRRHRPDVVRRVVRLAAAADVRSVRWAVRSIVPLRPDQRALFAGITAPVLVVAGQEDSTFPVAEVSAMASAIPTAELVVIENAAHLAALEVPPQVNGLIDEFLSG